MKKMIALFSALALLVSGTACGGGGGSQKTDSPEITVTQTIYKGESCEMPADLSFVVSMLNTPKGLLLVYNDMDMKLRGVYYDNDMKIGNSFPVEKSDTEWLSDFAVTDDGSLRAFSSKSTGSETAVAVKTFSSDGKLVSTTELGDLGGRLGTEYTSPNAVTYFGDDTLISFERDVFLVDGSGNVRESVPVDMNIIYSFDSEGGIICSNMHYTTRLDKLKVPSEKELSANPDNVSFIRPPVMGDERFSAYLILADGIYGMTSDGKKAMLLDFSASHIKSSDVSAVCPLGEGRFAVLAPDLTLLTVRPDDYKEERETVIIGKHNTVSSIERDTAADFTNINDDYFIEFREYDFEKEDLKLDILSGDSPDLYIPACHNEMIKYIGLGAVSDFAELYEKYGGMSEDDFLPNVVNGLKHNGKLYSMGEFFSPDLHMANREVISREQANWNYEDFYEIVAAQPADMYLSERHFLENPEQVFSWLCLDNCSDWIDYDKAECHFDSPEFIKLLEFCKNASCIGGYEPNYWETTTDEERQRDAREDLTLLGRKKALLAFSITNDHLDQLIGIAAAHSVSLDDITLVGQPNSSRHGTFKFGMSEYFVLNTGKCEQGAWEYLNYVLGYENEMEHIGGFSVNLTRKDAFEDIWEKKFEQFNENDNEITGGMNGYNYTYSLNITREQLDYFKAAVLSCDKLGEWDTNVSPILNEEFARCEAGEYTAEECAKAMQDRVSLYLSEQS